MNQSPQLIELRVSVDVGCYTHSVAIGLSTGDLLDEFEISHGLEGFQKFFSRIEKHRSQHGCLVAVAMEGFNGHARPLDAMVLTRRNYRLFNINNLKLARFKEVFPGAAKTDAIDARKGLELFQLQDSLPMAKDVLQEVSAVPVEHQMLKRITRRRKRLVKERVRVQNSLRADLNSICPGLLDITNDVGNLWFLRFITHGDSLPKLARLKSPTLLKISGVGAKYGGIIKSWQKKAQFSPDVEWVGEMIREDAARLLELHGKIKALEAKSEEIARRSPIATTLSSLPGFGPVCTAELAGEIGCITRFAKESSLALYLGMAPLTHSSGTHKGTRAPKHVNSRAKAAMMVAVDRHRKQVVESQKYYEKKRSEGKKHNQALRALGRHLSRVIYRMLKKERGYNTRN